LDLRPDVFTYVVKVELVDGQFQMRKGEVVLMR